MIWMFDRTTRTWAHAAIDKVAQQKDYYTIEVEKRLADEIETPGHTALRRLRNRDGLDPSARDDLAVYIGVMCMRVPRKRRKGKELAISVFQEMLLETRKELGDLSDKGEDVRIPRVLAELARIEAKYKDDPARMIPDQIDSPWASEQTIAAVAQMTWRFMLAPAGEHFVTADNPAFFFESYGLGTQLSELTFPVSSDLLLLGSHQGSAGSTLQIASTRSVLKEANRRVISGAERFVFSPMRASWIETVASRSDPYLSRLVW